MRYDPHRYHRRSIRLEEYDYAQRGAYFITIVTKERAFLFGNVVNGQMGLVECGEIARECWQDIPAHFPNVDLDGFVIMPNHVHGVLVLTDDRATGVGATHASPLRNASPPPHSPPTDGAPLSGLPRGPERASVGAVVGSYKSAVSRRVNAAPGTPGLPVWQRNYHEHIIRDEALLNRVRQYVLDNPALWALDRENPQAVAPELEEAWRVCRSPILPGSRS